MTTATPATLFQIAQRSVGRSMIQTVNARDLHEFLQVGKDFSTWINDRITRYQFAENVDYVLINQVLPKTRENPEGPASKGGRPRKDYHLTLDMAKELSMVERNEKGREARRYFIECERKVITGLSSQKSHVNYTIQQLMDSLKNTLWRQEKTMQAIIELHKESNKLHAQSQALQAESLNIQKLTLQILEKQQKPPRIRYRTPHRDDITPVRTAYTEGHSIRQIADSFGLSVGAVDRILTGKYTIRDDGSLKAAPDATDPAETVH